MAEEETTSELSSSSHSQATIKQKGYGNLVITPKSKPNIN
jgi:hypothetical protein